MTIRADQLEGVTFDNPITGIWYAYFSGFPAAFPDDRVGLARSESEARRLAEQRLALGFTFPVSGLCIPGHDGEVWSYQIPGERWDCSTAPLFRTRNEAVEAKLIAIRRAA